MKKENAMKLWKLQVEKQLRCGDGGVKATYTHSINCDCKRIDAEMTKLRTKQDEGDSK